MNLEHTVLSLYKHYSFIAGLGNQSLLSIPFVVRIDVHKTCVVACIGTTNNKGVSTYKRHRYSTFEKCHNGFVNTTVKMFVLSLPKITGPPCSTFLKIPAISHWDIRNTSKPYAAKTQIRKILSGLPICLNMILSLEALCPLADPAHRDLMCYRFKLTNFASSEKNPLQNSLKVSKIQLGKRLFGCFLQKLHEPLLRSVTVNPQDTSFDFEPLIHGSTS